MHVISVIMSDVMCLLNEDIKIRKMLTSNVVFVKIFLYGSHLIKMTKNY